jgi:hypothetical protein
LGDFQKFNHLIRILKSFFAALKQAYNPNTAIMKKIAMIMIFGSRGDIQPFVIVANLLVQKGYHVKLITHEEYPMNF